MSHCQVCGTLLEDRELEHEGIVPFCPRCGEFRFPMYNVAVSMIVINEENRKTLLVRQYRKDFYRLVAGYVNRGEDAEKTVAREVMEETGLEAQEIRFNRSRYFAGSNTLMLNWTVFVKDASALHTNSEIDSCRWFTFEEARANIKDCSLAQWFLNSYLDSLN